MKKSLTVGIIQSAPVYLDLEKSLEKAIGLIENAVGKGAELLVFGETWLSGYPAWLDYCPEAGLWDYEPVKEIFAQMYHNSIEIPGKETQILAELAQKHQVHIVMGVNEKISKGKANGTIFNSLLIFGPEGKLLNHHRKLMPTYTEKLLYGLGDGHGLQAVDTDFGRVGGLICWEHWMPLTRQTMHESAEHIHIAVWPTVHEMHQIASRHYAFEGRCFVIAVGQMMQVKDFPKGLKLPDEFAANPDKYVLRGGSCIIAPNGKYILEPQYNKDETLIQEIFDLDQVFKERMTLDVSGHYNRNDVFELNVNQKRVV